MRRLRRALATWVWWLAVAAALLLAVGALVSNVFQDREAAVVRRVLSLTPGASRDSAQTTKALIGPASSSRRPWAGCPAPASC